MNHRLLFWLFVTASTGASAQKVDSTASAVSSWQRVRIQRSGVTETAVSRVTTFSEPFLDNRNYWPTGPSGGYTFTLANGAYSIQRVGRRDGKSGRTFISLPDSIDLNRAGTFVIDVDMLTPKGSLPESGLLLGTYAAASYTLFVLRQTEFMVSRLVNGAAGSSGMFRPVGATIVVNPERNTLRIEKHDGKLFFAINGQDVPGDPLPFRKLNRNGLGFISSADTVTFQNLRITVGTL